MTFNNWKAFNTFENLKLYKELSEFPGFYCERDNTWRHGAFHLKFPIFISHTANIFTVKCKVLFRLRLSTSLELNWLGSGELAILYSFIKVTCPGGVDAIILDSCDTHCLRMLSVHLSHQRLILKMLNCSLCFLIGVNIFWITIYHISSMFRSITITLHYGHQCTILTSKLSQQKCQLVLRNDRKGGWVRDHKLLFITQTEVTGLWIVCL